MKKTNSVWSQFEETGVKPKPINSAAARIADTWKAKTKKKKKIRIRMDHLASAKPDELSKEQKTKLILTAKIKRKEAELSNATSIPIKVAIQKQIDKLKAKV